MLYVNIFFFVLKTPSCVSVQGLATAPMWSTMRDCPGTSTASTARSAPSPWPTSALSSMESTFIAPTVLRSCKMCKLLCIWEFDDVELTPKLTFWQKFARLPNYRLCQLTCIYLYKHNCSLFQSQGLDTNMTYFLCGFVMCTIYLTQDFVEPIETKVFSVAYWNLLGGKCF